MQGPVFGFFFRNDGGDDHQLAGGGIVDVPSTDVIDPFHLQPAGSKSAGSRVGRYQLGKIPCSFRCFLKQVRRRQIVTVSIQDKMHDNPVVLSDSPGKSRDIADPVGRKQAVLVTIRDFLDGILDFPGIARGNPREQAHLFGLFGVDVGFIWGKGL